MSDEEAISALDEQLDDSIAVFDSMMGEARAGAAEAAATDGEDAGAGTGGDTGPLFEEGDLASEPEGGAAGSANGDGEQGGGWGSDNESTSAKTTTTYGKEGGVAGTLPGGRAPDNIPDGSDDDIVARQIREAAIKEQDPVLKEKLWDEYRKYKQGQ
ncbi:hypothetical protein [Porticoccus sp.]